MTKTVFFGTPDAATPTLETLHRIADVVAVVTKPDRPQGRSSRPVGSPVKATAERLGLAVLQPAKMGEIVDVAATADLGVLVAFGRILPARLLEAPRLGIVNIHFSILPRWRGASPVHHAILAGDSRTGVSLMQMDAGLDTGGVLATCHTIVGDSNVGELTARLSLLGADLVAATWQSLAAGTLAAHAQDEANVTIAPLLTPDDLHLTPHDAAPAVLRHIRAFAPSPGAWGTVDGGRFKIIEGRLLEAKLEPGQIGAIDGKPALGTSTTAIELVVVQPAGKAPLAGIDWFNGRRREPARLT